MSFTGSRGLTKRMIGDITDKISRKLHSGFPEVVLQRISVAAYVAAFPEHVALTETLQWHKNNFS